MLHCSISFLAGLLLVGYEQAREAKSAYKAVATVAETSQSLEKTMQDTQTRQAERAKSGDTLVLPYKELQRYLPDAVPGFATADAPTGQTIKMTGMNCALVSRDYHQGTQTLTVSLADYNNSAEMFTAAAAITALGMEMYSDDQYIGRLDLGQPSLKAYERYGKKDHQAPVTVAVGDCFVATVSAGEQSSIAAVQAAAKALQYDALNKL